MGIIKLPSQELTVGYEAAGVIQRVGPNAKMFAVGDRVVLYGIKTFYTVITATELLYEESPDELSSIDGASMPLVLMISIYCIIDVEELRKGQVSINSTAVS